MAAHREYVECKLSSLQKYTSKLDIIIAWVMETKTRINISKELSEKEKKRVIDNIMVNILVLWIGNFSYKIIAIYIFIIWLLWIILYSILLMIYFHQLLNFNLFILWEILIRNELYKIAPLQCLSTFWMDINVLFIGRLHEPSKPKIFCVKNCKHLFHCFLLTFIYL